MSATVRDSRKTSHLTKTFLLAGLGILLAAGTGAAAEGGAEAGSTLIEGVPTLWLIAPLASVLGLIFSYVFFQQFIRVDEGTDMMRRIAQHIREGANAYLRRQYTIVAIVFAVLFVVFLVLALLGVQNPFTPPAFLAGGFFSGLCGFLGMRSATQASARTANMARESLNGGLKVAFRSGAVMGLSVVGFGLINVAVWYFAMVLIYRYNMWGMAESLAAKGGFEYGEEVWKNPAFVHAMLGEITSTMLTFGIGASTMALFARVGGGIYTKAADVGADLVGKVEAGIPEDDPRNPATIADNVGDNVGDVAGMGADLYESYVGSILATAALGASIPLAVSRLTNISTSLYTTLPMIVAGLGIVFSIVSVFLVRCKEDATQKNLLRALLIGTFSGTVLVVLALAVMSLANAFTWGLFGAVVAGLVAGVIIGQSTEWFTADEYRWTRGVAEQAPMGAAPTIIEGIAIGMLSSAIPVVTIVAAIIVAFGFAGGFGEGAGAMNQGLYGVAFAAVGMLSNLGITLATDAYGPVADNAGGNAEMSGLDPKVRERTDALDALGNTTAATGKGFAIGSAALTAMALLAAYVAQLPTMIKSFLADNPVYGIARTETAFYLGNEVPAKAAELQEQGWTLVNAANAEMMEIPDLVGYFGLNLLNTDLLGGLFLGAMMAFVFCGLTMRAVGRSAGEMVEEARRQFDKLREKLMADGMSAEQAQDPDNWPQRTEAQDGEAIPNYAHCVQIATTGAQKEMIVPSLLAIIIPILVGLVLGVAGVLGLLAGALVAGLSLACLLNNGGGSWDNAKKWIEKGNKGGKGSDAHKASVVGDTVGDPFKDTSGPSLNILIKLMAMTSVAFAGLVVAWSPLVRAFLHLGG
jgi:K(+)-stimulated pyrophosphate-energized sodium pump